MTRMNKILAPLVLALVIAALLVVAGCSNTPAQQEGSSDNPLVAKPETSTTPPAKLITPEEVGRIAKIEGVKLVPQGSTKMATGALNFANEKGGIFLIVRLSDMNQYAASLSSSTLRHRHRRRWR